MKRKPYVKRIPPVKATGRRKGARPKSPQQITIDFNTRDRQMRGMMRDFHVLKVQLGLKNTSDAHLKKLGSVWKQGNNANLGLLKKLIRLKPKYVAALKRSVIARRLIKMRLVRDPKFMQIENIEAFTHRAFQLIKAREKAGKGYSMAIVDLDKFKAVNDTFGHAAGDVVIGKIADILSRFAQEHGGAAARVGGEEFRLFVPMGERTLSVALKQLAPVFSAELTNPRSFGVSPIKSWAGWKAPTFSAGVAGKKGSGLIAGFNNLISSLATKSDAALYKAKETRNTVKIA